MSGSRYIVGVMIHCAVCVVCLSAFCAGGLLLRILCRILYWPLTCPSPY